MAISTARGPFSSNGGLWNTARIRKKRRKAKAQGEGGDGDLPDTVVNPRNEVMTRWKRERGPETIFRSRGRAHLLRCWPLSPLQMTKKKMLVSVLFAVPVGFESNSWKVSRMDTLNGGTDRLFSDRYGDEKSDRVVFLFFYFDTTQWREGHSICGSCVLPELMMTGRVHVAGRRQSCRAKRKQGERTPTNTRGRVHSARKQTKRGQELSSPHSYSSDRHKTHAND